MYVYLLEEEALEEVAAKRALICCFPSSLLALVDFLTGTGFVAWVVEFFAQRSYTSTSFEPGWYSNFHQLLIPSVFHGLYAISSVGKSGSIVTCALGILEIWSMTC